MWWWLGIGSVAVVGGLVLLVPRSAVAGGGSAFANKLRPYAKKFSAEVRELARKYARMRNLSEEDVLAAILLESRGNPKGRQLSEKEDSRGLMGVNIRAHAALLKQHGWSPDDLYKPEVGVNAGTEIFARSKARVDEHLQASRVRQYHDRSTLYRLHYAGPAYVDEMLTTAKNREETKHPFKDAEIYVAHWHDARAVVREVLL